MKHTLVRIGWLTALAAAPVLLAQAAPPVLKAGIAVEDITPSGPIWLSGYAARNRPSDRVEAPLRAGAIAFEDPSGTRLCLLTLDNCGVSDTFMAPVLDEIARANALPRGHIITLSSHTHSAPCLAGALPNICFYSEEQARVIAAYSAHLQEALARVAAAAFADLRPAVLAHGTGRAGFAMNRRAFMEHGVVIADNPDGPVDHRVPVMRIAAPDGALRAVVFAYACHGTTIGGGEEFYWVSPDYMGYARAHIEQTFPGAKAFFMTGCGADMNPSPRGTLAHAKQHGLELAGAVAGVLGRPMRPIAPTLRVAHARIDLPLVDPPTREQLEADARSDNRYIRGRAHLWLAALEQGGAMPRAVDYPLAAVRFGNEVTAFFLAGEVVVDYALRIARELAADNPWTMGFAIEIPCYIPSMRVLREGGYEPESSFIYYGIYGPFLPRVETVVMNAVRELGAQVRGK